MLIPLGNRSELPFDKNRRACVHVDEIDLDVALFENTEGKLIAINDQCPHRHHVHLSKVGTLDPPAKHVTCIHASFDLKGRSDNPRCCPSTKTYEVSVDASENVSIKVPDSIGKRISDFFWLIWGLVKHDR